MKHLTILLLSAASLQLSAFAQGPLTPPGAPAPTMKTLDQIEPRTPISSVPYTISQPGSYYLTTNLTGVAGFNGVNIAASGVTLDLMGFELAGVAGSLDGVNVSIAVTNIAIRNGTVRNWGGDGVDAGNAHNDQHQDLRLSANGGRGLISGTGSVVVKCTARGNSNDGIATFYGSTVSGCSAFDNTGDGIDVLDGSTVSGCSASFNTGNGIITGFGSTISGCTAYANGKGGIRTDSDSTVSGCTAYSNTSDGIRVSGDCRVVANACNFNGSGGDGAGIHATSADNRIDSNNVTDNDRGIDVDVAGNLIIKNSASGNSSSTASNYVFTGTQTFGPTNSLVGAGGVITNQNPWANFSF